MEREFVDLFRWRLRDISWSVLCREDRVYLNALLPGLRSRDGLISPVCVRTVLPDLQGTGLSDIALPPDFPEKVESGASLIRKEDSLYLGDEKCEDLPPFMRHELPGGGRNFRLLKGSLNESPLEVFVPANRTEPERDILKTLFTERRGMKNMIPENTSPPEDLSQHVKRKDEAVFEGGIPAREAKKKTPNDEDVPSVQGMPPPTVRKVNVEDAITFVPKAPPEDQEDSGSEDSETADEKTPPWEDAPGMDCPPDIELGVVPSAEERKKEKAEKQKAEKEKEKEKEKAVPETASETPAEGFEDEKPEQGGSSTENSPEEKVLRLVDASERNLQKIHELVSSTTNNLEDIRLLVNAGMNKPSMDLTKVLERVKEALESEI